MTLSITHISGHAEFKTDLDMEVLDLPTHGIPVYLFDSLRARPGWHVGDQLPLDRLASLRCAALGGMDHGQVQCWIALLLADRRQYVDPFGCYFQSDRYRVAIFVANPNAMQSFYCDLIHLIRNCVVAIARKPVRLHTHDKMRAQVVGQAVKFENVALAIADVDAAIRFTEKPN